MNGQVWFMRSVALGGPVELADSTTAGGGHGHPRVRRAAWIVAAVLFAAAPWASLGLATPLAFLLAAALVSRLHRAHASVLWISAAVYAAALAVQIAHENSPSGAIVGIAIILTFVVGGLQALVTVALAARGHDPGLRDIARAWRHLWSRQRRARPRRRQPAALRRGSTWERRLRNPGFWLRHPVLAASTLVILATACIAIGVALRADGRSFMAHHEVATGVVIASVSDPVCNLYTGGCSSNYDTTVRYRPPGSGPLVHREGWRDYVRPGTHIPVYYDPRDPSDASLWPDKRDLVAGNLWIVGGLGGAVLLGGYGCTVMIRYRKKRSHPSTALRPPDSALE
jgi:hypothetical protein